MSSKTSISLTNVSKVFKQYKKPADRLKEIIFSNTSKAKEFWALRNINLEIFKGETIGIIGRNGAGKSTLLQIIAKTLQPTTGNVDVHGRVAALLELGSGFNPEFTGHQNIFFNGRILGLTQIEIEERYEQIVAFADIGDFIHQPVKTYSSGMFVRLAFAVKANIDASIIIIDEALAVGDVFFRQKCFDRLEQQRKSGATILLVSHSMPDIEQYCKRAILLDKGITKFSGSSSDAAKHYYLLHQSSNKSVTVKPSKKSKNSDTSKPVKSASKTDSTERLSITHTPLESQITNNQARCIKLATYNSKAEPCNNFRQGDKIVFYYEFEINEFIEIPICGIVIKNDRGIIVHGKNAWQTCENLPENLEPGTKLACEQEMILDLRTGEYTFEIGLVSLSKSLWHQRTRISHKEMSAKRIRICHISNAGSFTIGVKIQNNVEFLPHYGLANLPGKIKMYTLTSSV